MRIDDGKPGYADTMHAGEPLAAVGVIEHCGAVAVVPPDDGDMARTPQYNTAMPAAGAVRGNRYQFDTSQRSRMERPNASMLAPQPQNNRAGQPAGC